MLKILICFALLTGECPLPQLTYKSNLPINTLNLQSYNVFKNDIVILFISFNNSADGLEYTANCNSTLTNVRVQMCTLKRRKL